VPKEENEPLAAFLSSRDVPCPGCGYNLRGLTSDHCPECYQHLVLSVSLAEPPVVQYVLAMVGLAACGAAAGLMVLGVLAISVLYKDLPGGNTAVVLLWAPLAIVGVDAAMVASCLLPASRRWFRTRSRSGRWMIALACWGASLAVFAAWLAVLFQVT
jgi:hypothetical protein